MRIGQWIWIWINVNVHRADGQARAALSNSISSGRVVSRNAEDMVDTGCTATVNKYPKVKNERIMLNS